MSSHLSQELAGQATGLLLLSCPLVAQSPPVLVETDPPGSSASTRVAMATERDTVYAVWEDYRNGQRDVYFNRSVDAGRTWMPEDVRLDSGSPPGPPAGFAHAPGSPVLSVAEGRVYVVWPDERNGEYDVYFNRSLDGGLSWLPTDVRIDTDGAGVADSQWPQIASKGARVFVTWTDFRSGSGEIYFSRSLDAGESWSPADVRLNTVTSESSTSRIAVSGGALVVPFVDARSGLKDILLQRSTDDGETWLEQELRLDVDPGSNGDSQGVRLATSGSNAYAIWWDTRHGPGDVFLNRSTDGGATWLPDDVRVNTDPAGQSLSRRPRLFAQGSAVHAAWISFRNGSLPADPANDPAEIYFNRSLDRGTTWLDSDVRLDVGTAPGTLTANRPALAAVGSTVAAVWQDVRSGEADLYLNLSTDAGTTWRAADVRVDVGDPPGSSSSIIPSLAVTSSAMCVAWEDDRYAPDTVSQRGDILFNVATGTRSFGDGSAGTGGFVPVLTAADLPVLGQTFELDLGAGFGTAPAWLLVTWAGSPLFPVSDLPTWQLYGLLCGPGLDVVATHMVPAVLSGPPTAGVGSTQWTGAIPPDPASTGVTFSAQALVLDPRAPCGVALSNAVEVWIL